MTEPWWRTLLREQQDSGFADVGGTHAAVVLPVTDRLITDIVASRLPSSVPVRSLEIRAEAGDRFIVRVKLTTPALMPALSVRFAIVEQPRLPSRPVLVCAVLSEGFGALMGPLVRLFARLPDWIRFSDNRFHLDLSALAAQQGLTSVLEYVSEIEVTTVPGRFVVAVQGGLPSGRSAA